MTHHEIENLVSAAAAKTKAEVMPVGTIITSMLPFAKFRSSMNDAGVWSAGTSKWSPADGRQVLASKYATLLFENNPAQAVVPDLRGVFLRGLNSFDPGYAAAPLNPAQLDPDNDANNVARVGGSLQLDAFKSHNHSSHGHQGAPILWGDHGPHAGHVDQNGNSTGAEGGSETRPKNCAVYYYIKIN